MDHETIKQALGPWYGECLGMVWQAYPSIVARYKVWSVGVEQPDWESYLKKRVRGVVSNYKVWVEGRHGTKPFTDIWADGTCDVSEEDEDGLVDWLRDNGYWEFLVELSNIGVAGYCQRHGTTAYHVKQQVLRIKKEYYER